MLQSSCMTANTSRRRVRVATLAYLLLFPQPYGFPGPLRDEASKYRQDGYERQRIGDLDGALSMYQKAAALDPTYAAPQNDAGVLLEQRGQLEAAKAAYQQALQIDPNYLEAHTNSALLAERMGDKGQAVYHWLKRYQLGDANDPWTARAEERLVALGALKNSPGLKGKIYTQRKLVEQELQSYERSKQDFRAATERWQQ